LKSRWLVHWYFHNSPVRATTHVEINSAGLPSGSLGFGLFAATQAACRFYNNTDIEFHELVEPMRQYVRTQACSTAPPFLIVALEINNPLIHVSLKLILG